MAISIPFGYRTTIHSNARVAKPKLYQRGNRDTTWSPTYLNTFQMFTDTEGFNIEVMYMPQLL